MVARKVGWTTGGVQWVDGCAEGLPFPQGVEYGEGKSVYAFPSSQPTDGRFEIDIREAASFTPDRPSVPL